MIPFPYRAVQVHARSPDFRSATQIVTVPNWPTPAAGSVLVWNHYVGINAADAMTNRINERSCPAPCGLEAVGCITDVAADVTDFRPGDTVAYQHTGAFAEYTEVPARQLIRIDEVTPEILPLLISGASASLALTRAGEMTANEKVLVTSSADGTGLFAVQLAKAAGNHVIAVCSSDEAAAALSELGCDRVLNSSVEPVGYKLRTEYPSGIDLALDLSGGAMFRTCVENLAPNGRIVAVEAVSQLYEVRDHAGQGAENNAWRVRELKTQLLNRSASFRGFSLFRCEDKLVRQHVLQLLELVKAGSIQSRVDSTDFVGLDVIADAIERLVNQQNIGKIVVRLVSKS